MDSSPPALSKLRQSFILEFHAIAHCQMSVVLFICCHLSPCENVQKVYFSSWTTWIWFEILMCKKLRKIQQCLIEKEKMQYQVLFIWLVILIRVEFTKRSMLPYPNDWEAILLLHWLCFLLICWSVMHGNSESFSRKNRQQLLDVDTSLFLLIVCLVLISV